MSRETLTIADFQREVGEWSRRNFPDNTPDEPMEGIVEEVGEWAHARLKARQGIRGTVAEHEVAERDAIGDVAIYAVDYAERKGLDLAYGLRDLIYPRFVGNTFAELDEATSEALDADSDATPTLAFRHAVSFVGELAVADYPTAADVAVILRNLAGYCALRGWSFAEIVAETWAKVSRRNWRANPDGPPREASSSSPRPTPAGEVGT